ncbi:MAG: DUF4139 domain-containing protein [Bacteroidia bacterium]
MLKKQITVIILVIFCFEPKAQNQELVRTIDAPVQEVTVFLNQAQVVRSIKTWVLEGITTLRFEKISPFLIEQSLQVYADERLQILSVIKVNNYLNEDEKPNEIIALEDSLNNIEKLLVQRKKAKDVLQFEKEVLLANKQIGGAQTGLKADELEDVLAIFRKRLNEIENDFITHNEEEKKLNKTKARLAKQLNEYTQGIRNLSTAVDVTVKVNQSLSNAQFELRYMVNQAKWLPSYDVRVLDAGQPVTFVLKAHVIQTTGEDWKNVKLKLSTANPTISAVKPVLQTHYIRFFQPLKPVAAPKATRLKANAYGADGDVMNEMATGEAAPMFETTETMVNTEFVANNLHHIPSGAQGSWVELINQNSKALFRYAAVPKLDHKVFATALVAGIDIINQIPAQADVYFQGTYTGKTFIGQTVNDTIEISLGSDKRLIIERKKVKDFSSNTFLGSNKILTNSFEIVVRNNKKETVEILVEDQIPVSTEKDIEVKLTLNPNNGIFEPNEGKLTWKIRLEPNKAETIRFGFEIKHPKNKMIAGF